MKEEQPDGNHNQGGFWTGTFLTLTSALLVTFLLLFIASFSQQSIFWAVVIIASVLPITGIYLTKKWGKRSNKSMANGARISMRMGVIIAVCVVLWFHSFLNSLGG